MKNLRIAVLIGILSMGFILAGGLLYSIQSLSSPPTPRPGAPPGAIISEPAAARRLTGVEAPVALVNGEPIGRADWQRASALNRVMGRLSGAPSFDTEATLESLVNQHLVLQGLVEAGVTLTVTPSQALDRLHTLGQSWGVEDALLSALLAEAGLTEQDTLQELTRMLQVEQGMQWITRRKAPEAWLAARRQEARISILSDLASTAPPAQNPSPAETAASALASSSPTAQPPTPAAARPETGVQPGQTAPDFSLADLDGKPVQLSDYRGRVVLVNFWATWCPPCQKEFAALNTAAKKYRDQGVVILSINQKEDAAVVRQSRDQNDLGYPILLDSDGEVGRQYSVRGTPTTLFIGPDGVIARRTVGPLDDAQIDSYLEPLLAASRARPTAVFQASLPGPAVSVTTETLSTTPLSPGSLVDFSLPDGQGRTISPHSYRGKSSVVLVFYREST